MLEGVMRYCEFPLGLKHKYQVYTCADLTQLREAGYCEPIMGLEEGGQRYCAGLLVGASLLAPTVERLFT